MLTLIVASLVLCHNLTAANADRDVDHLVKCTMKTLDASFQESKTTLMIMDKDCTFLPGHHIKPPTMLSERILGRFEASYWCNVLLAKLQSRSENRPVLLSRSSPGYEKNDKIPESDYNVLISLGGEKYRQLEKLISWLNSTSWDSRSRCVVVSVANWLSGELEEGDWALAIAKVVSQTRILNVTILVAIATGLGDPDRPWNVYKRAPGHSQDECQRKERLYIANSWSKENGGHFKKRFLYGASKQSIDFNGCLIIASGCPHPPFVLHPVVTRPQPCESGHKYTGTNESDIKEGLDIKLLMTIGKRINATILFKHVECSEKVAYVHSRRSDVALTTMPFFHNKLLPVDYTKSYAREQFVWVVPEGRRLPKWLNLVFIFSSDDWIRVIASILIGIVFYWALSNRCFRFRSKSSRVHETWHDFGSGVLNIVSTALAVPVTRNPRTPALRVFFLAWAFYCLNIDTAYQSKLFYSLTHTSYEPRITSLEGILNSGLTIRLPKFAIDVIKSTMSEDLQRVLDKYELDETCNQDCIDELALKQNMVTLSMRLPTEYKIYSQYTQRGHASINILDEAISHLDIKIAVRKGSSLLQILDEFIKRLFESGLMKKWLDDLKAQSRIRHNESRALKDMAEEINQATTTIKDETENATRMCHANGSWDSYTDYNSCSDMHLMSVEQGIEAVTATTLTTLYFVGYSISLVAISIAIYIFIYFKKYLLFLANNEYHCSVTSLTLCSPVLVWSGWYSCLWGTNLSKDKLAGAGSIQRVRISSREVLLSEDTGSSPSEARWKDIREGRL
uniref:Solute-binding protein family 3/N-terminal domain-containing protein n=1 Tax=Timema monikensis TaxID=170555 RepID=A0A7R9E1B6_9NEOP|nr:unnamed protein product [Timema monikensis]